MRALIENYRNLTAEHCGSGAMRNLLYHYSGLALDEGVVFGLGSGLDCIYFTIAGVSPPYMLFGRSICMEQDLAAALGIDYREMAQPDDELAWQVVQQEVMAGRPTMLSGDIYYLDYRDFKVHFPSHRFVLLGFDEERQEGYIADRTDSAIQTCSLQALRLSRNPPVGISTYNLWGKFHHSSPAHELPLACELALRKTVERMQGLDSSQTDLMALSLGETPQTIGAGLAGLRTLGDAMTAWHQPEDAGAYARYLVNAIVKFGTGGAFFRSLYADFLHWSQRQRPELVDSRCVEIAERGAREWTALADIAQALTDNGNDREGWQRARQQVMVIHESERELFGRLAEALR